MKLSTTLNHTGSPREAADLIVGLEQAGLDTVWIAEAYGFDAPSLMGYVAAKTERIEIGSAIINIFSRTAATLAQTAAGLDHLSGGRAVLGLGASGPQVVEGFHGMAYERPITRTREVVDVIRMALRREPVQYDGKTVTLPLPEGRGVGLGKTLKLVITPQRPAVPIWLAALGAKNVELTAEIADGWIPTLYIPEKANQIWGAPLAAGAAKRSPDLGPLQVVAGGLCAIGEDVKDLLELARPTTALYIGGMGPRGSNFYNQLLCDYGYPREAKEIQDLYLAGKRDQAAACVPQELLESMNLIGPEGHVKERIAAFRESGVTNLQIVPVGANAPSLVRRMKELMA